eukprot:m.126083 g.126083  ORF g.126083 m.126083 type:complete len:164 (-) comp17352_c0_seq7:236-727(-)
MIKIDRATRKRSCQENSIEFGSPGSQQQCGLHDIPMKRFGVSAPDTQMDSTMDVEGQPTVFEEGIMQASMQNANVEIRFNKSHSLQEEQGISIRPHSQKNSESKMMNAWVFRSHIQRMQRQAKRDMEMAQQQIQEGVTVFLCLSCGISDSKYGNCLVIRCTHV